MGYRSQNNYDEYKEQQRRRLPWRERYNWGNVAVLAVVVIGIVAWFVLRR